MKAILSIADTLQISSSSTKQSNPYNAQGQQLPTTTAPPQPLNPFMATQPPSLPSLAKKESVPYVDPRTLPPPIATTSTNVEVRPIPPPPQSVSATNLKRPLPPRSSDGLGAPATLKGVPMNRQPVMNKLPAKLPARTTSTPAKPAAIPSLSTPTDHPSAAPVRLFPQGPVLGHPPLASTVGISEESRAFVEYINTSVAMQQDNEVKSILPISNNSQQIYSIVSEGWLLW